MIAWTGHEYMALGKASELDLRRDPLAAGCRRPATTRARCAFQLFQAQRGGPVNQITGTSQDQKTQKRIIFLVFNPPGFIISPMTTQNKTVIIGGGAWDRLLPISCA